MTPAYLAPVFIPTPQKRKDAGVLPCAYNTHLRWNQLGWTFHRSNWFARSCRQLRTRLAVTVSSRSRSVEGAEERNGPGLTRTAKEPKTARGGDSPLRASFIRIPGSHSMRRKRW